MTIVQERRSVLSVAGLAGVLVALAPAPVAAQCIAPANSNEARLLAFYEAPIAFSGTGAPAVLPTGGVALTGELVGVPTPPRSLTHTNLCFAANQEASHLSPVLPRLRLEVGLPAGFAVEGSYLPPITVDQAQPSLGSLALTYTDVLYAPGVGRRGPSVTLGLRADATVGRVRGSITCSRAALQLTDPGAPCYGSMPSRDTFYPNTWGGEGTLGVGSPGGRVSGFAGVGYARLTPHFRVGFTDQNGVTDRTLVEAQLNRGTVFGGIDVRVLRALDAAAEVYSVPADLTTWRLTARYRLW